MTTNGTNWISSPFCFSVYTAEDLAVELEMPVAISSSLKSIPQISDVSLHSCIIDVS